MLPGYLEPTALHHIGDTLGLLPDMPNRIVRPKKTAKQIDSH
jgi:hypothetical protein